MDFLHRGDCEFPQFQMLIHHLTTEKFQINR